jgi:hypothetical protein
MNLSIHSAIVCAALLPVVVSADDAAPATKPPKLTPIAEIKGFSSPESIAADATHLFVSNVGRELKPTDKDGDGFISRMGLKGEAPEFRFIEGLHAPKGLLINGGTLFVCDVDTLLGFNPATREKTFELSFAGDGVKFLNDVCAGPAGTLFVSATDTNTVYKVDVAAKSAKPLKFDKALKGPNGLAFIHVDESNYLVLAEWGADNQPNGTVHAAELEGDLLTATVEETDEDFPIKNGFLDGIAILSKDGEPSCMLHSDWVDFKSGGKLHLTHFEGEDGKVQATPLSIGEVGGPADFHFDPKSSTLALPCMIDGRVLLFKLELEE